MAFSDLLDHTVYIQRNEDTGTEDDYGQPVTTPEVSGLFPVAIQPKSVREMALASQAGVAIGDFSIFMNPRLVNNGEAIIHDTDLCPKSDETDYADCRFEILGVRDPTGRGHHLTIDARMVGAGGGVEGS